MVLVPADAHISSETSCPDAYMVPVSCWVPGHKFIGSWHESLRWWLPTTFSYLELRLANVYFDKDEEDIPPHPCNGSFFKGQGKEKGHRFIGRTGREDGHWDIPGWG